LEPSLKDEIEIIKTPCHVGRLNSHSLISLFTDIIKEHKLSINKETNKYEGIYLACNTLNSYFRRYKGAYDHLIQFLDDHKRDRTLIVCTPNTKKMFNKNLGWKYKNVEVMSLDHEVVKKIDRGELVNIELKTDMFKYLLLGCTHYDLINFNTNMTIISTSKMLAQSIIKEYKQ